MTIEKARKHLWRVEKMTDDADYNSTTWEELKTASWDDLISEAECLYDNHLNCCDSNPDDTPYEKRATQLYGNWLRKYRKYKRGAII